MKSKGGRVDEIGRHYAPLVKLDKASHVLFWLTAGLSLFMVQSASWLNAQGSNAAEAVFLTLVLLQFALSQFSRRYLLPRAESMRRRQLLTDAFGVPLSHDRTALYYNNRYAPSVRRLGANTLENTLFTKEVTARMLVRRRTVVGLYIALWVIAFALRHDNLSLLTWITQLVFSQQIVVGLIKLEELRCRSQRVFDALHAHFLHGVGGDTPAAIAAVLDNFTEYESAKSAAGVLLSSKVFNELNPRLTERWNRIRIDLCMDEPESKGPSA